MKALPLDPGDYDGTYKLIAGRMSLDFVNTVSWPDEGESHDWLDRPGNAIQWALAVELIDRATADALTQEVARDPEGAARDLVLIRHQRATIERVLRPLADGERPSGPDIERFNALLTRSWRRRKLNPDDLSWSWEAPEPRLEEDRAQNTMCPGDAGTGRLAELMGPVVDDAANLLAEGDHRRVGACPRCRWLFYDTTRNRSRRWCDMSDCGSRDKALRYYHRQKEATG